MTAWAVLTVSALWTMTTAVAEATVVTNAAVSRAKEMFEAWWAFAEGKASGVAFLALAIAVISGNEAQSSERAYQRGPLGLAWFRRLRPSLAGLWGGGSGLASETSFGWHPPSSWACGPSGLMRSRAILI